MIRVDASAETVVVVCTRCHWRTMADDRPQGWRLGLRHELQVHPADRAAIHAASSGLLRARRRRA